MNEGDALSGLLRRKRHSIPLAVRYWIFYKRHVLEKAATRLQFMQKRLDYDEFTQLMTPLLKASPARGRNKGKKWIENLNRDMMQVLYVYHKALLDVDCDWIVQEGPRGLGLFAKRAFAWNESDHSKRLFGIVCDVSEEDFSILQEKKYPSLFSSRNTGDGILFGCASLLNHSCDAMMRWAAPSKRGAPELFEGFNALRVKPRLKPRLVAGNKKKKAITFEEGDEITVLYGMRRKDFKCGCRKCSRLESME